jgi:alpha-glucosidase
VPLPWSGEAPPFGFSTNPDTWLPMPADWATLTVQRQEADPDSTLNFYRRAIELRSRRAEFSGGVQWVQDGVFTRAGGLRCVLNTGQVPVPLPTGDVLLASGPLSGGLLPPDTAAWLV